MKKILIFALMLFSFPCAAQHLIDSKKVEHIGVLTIGTLIFSTTSGTRFALWRLSRSNRRANTSVGAMFF